MVKFSPAITGEAHLDPGLGGDQNMLVENKGLSQANRLIKKIF